MQEKKVVGALVFSGENGIRVFVMNEFQRRWI